MSPKFCVITKIRNATGIDLLEDCLKPRAFRIEAGFYQSQTLGRYTQTKLKEGRKLINQRIYHSEICKTMIMSKKGGMIKLEKVEDMAFEAIKNCPQ